MRRQGPARPRALAGLLAVLVVGVAAGCGADREPTTTARTAPPGAERPPTPVDRGPPRGPLALHVARRTQLRATPGGKVLGVITKRTVYRSPVYLPVIERRDGWVRVRSSMPSARSGWVPADAGALLRQPRSIVIDLSDRRLRIVHRGRVTHSYRVAIGSAQAPTPVGTFYVTDRLTVPPGTDYGCCILPLNVRQPHIPQGWGGGDRIAIHGTTHTWVLGQPITHGCIRASDRAMRRVMSAVRLGTPVRIRR